MIITYKVRHQFDLSVELKQAHQVAVFAIKNRNKLSSKEVTFIGLKSALSNQILRKYGKNRKCKSVKKVNLIVPNQAIKVENKSIRLVPLKMVLNISHLPSFIKVNQVELSKQFAYVSVEVKEAVAFQPTSFVGLDRNATSHCAVLANVSTGKTLKLGSNSLHLRNKYRNLRSSAQSKAQYKRAKRLSNRETNIMKNLNHQISKKIINYCLENKSALVLEDLKGIRKQKSKGKKLNGMLNSWAFYQLESFLTYKALRYGVPIMKIDPQYTSQQCSKCGVIGKRDKKHFSCSNCKHSDHSDVNAAFCIARKGRSSDQDRDWLESLFSFPNYKNEITDKAQSEHP
jgi:putative transposase